MSAVLASVRASRPRAKQASFFFFFTLVTEDHSNRHRLKQRLLCPLSYYSPTCINLTDSTCWLSRQFFDIHFPLYTGCPCLGGHLSTSCQVHCNRTNQHPLVSFLGRTHLFPSNYHFPEANLKHTEGSTDCVM